MGQKQSILKLAFSVLFSVLFFVSCTKDDKAKIHVQIKELDKSYAVIQEQRVSGIKILDTVNFSKSGKFNYSFKIKQPGFYTINIPGNSSIFLLLSPKDKVKISAVANETITDLKITGSPESEKLNMLYDSLFAARSLLKDIREKYEGSALTVEKDKLYGQYTKILDDYRKFSMGFVLDNLHSLLSVAALYQEIGPNEFVFGRKRDLQFFKLATDTLTKYYPKHRHVITLQQNYNQLMSSLQIDRIFSKVDEVGEGLPDLQLPDFSGNIVSLNSVKERYILLYFWQNTDELSSKMFPSYNTIFNNYHSKGFTIYNVFLGKSMNLGQDILRFEELEKWINVADTAYPYSQSRMLYNVVTIPSNYLIDSKEKTILAKDINPQQLNQYLAEIIR